MESKVVYLMRGLPSCGKSHTARRLAGDTGLVFETDAYFYVPQLDGTVRYTYDESRLTEARRWCLERFQAALRQGRTPLVVDRGNGLNRESRLFAMAAAEHGYRIELKEPDSPWWQQICTLLRDKDRCGPALDRCAIELAKLSRRTHSVPAATIRRWMDSWRCDLTVAEILPLK